MRYWWVNQNQTYKFEVGSGYLWSPKKNANGAFNKFYENMSLVAPGDLIFSFSDTHIKAIGMAQRAATTAPKPNFGPAGLNWSSSGWQVEVEFSELVHPFRPKDNIDLIRDHLPSKYSPLLPEGNGKQGVYLAEITKELAELLIALSNVNMGSVIRDIEPAIDLESDYEIRLEIEAKGIEGDLEKVQLVKARRGQGIFKSNVRLIESHCRITQVNSIKHLRASHIKPWRLAEDSEKLDGSNGLLLAPHADHLFDQGFISFNNNGDVMVSNHLDRQILNNWSIEVPMNVGSFKDSQAHYLRFHREEIFKQ
jgi:putative restriction endonuclease